MPFNASVFFSQALKVADESLGGSVIAFDNQTLFRTIAMIVNLIILVLILTKLLYNPVKNYMANRSEHIANEIKSAQDEYNKAQELKEKYEEKLKNIEKEREVILSQTHKMAMQRSDHILEEAREESEHIYQRGLATLERERENVQDEMKRQMIEVSMLVANEFVQVSISREDQNKYIDQALADWEEGLWLD